jgi:Bacterial nucleoid DNA-binding protein
VIKLDIINEVVNRTGITKTKAELAVETVFESMKKALSTETASSCAVSEFSMCVRARLALVAILERALKFLFPRARLFASNPVKNCSQSTNPPFRRSSAELIC